MNNLMTTLREIVTRKVNNGEVIRTSNEHIDIAFQRNEENNNVLDVTIFRQNFDVTTGDKQVVSEFDGFKVNTILLGQILDENNLAVSGILDVKYNRFPSKFSGIVDDMSRYIARALATISMINFSDTKVNADFQLKKLINSISEKEVYHICKVCGKEISKDQDMCDDCKSKYIPCSECGTHHFKEKLYEYKGKFYCENCLSSNLRSVSLTSYSTKVEPTFFGSANERHYGVEIEVERTRDAKYSEEKTISILNKYSNCSYYKHDGSLNNGFEWITHPCTIQYHKENTVPLISVLKRLGYGTSSGRCGLHIHVGRNVFGNNKFDVSKNVGRLLWLQDYFKKEFKKLSKRERYDYCHDLEKPQNSHTAKAKELLDNLFVSPDVLLGDSQNVEVNKEDINLITAISYYISGNQADRYHAINLRNTPTVEFRLPQGTMSTNDFIAYIQLYDRAIEIACSDDIKFTEFSFKELFKGIYGELDNLIAETL